MVEYTLVSLPCWAQGCLQHFDDATARSNHSLAAHEAPLQGFPVRLWLARAAFYAQHPGGGTDAHLIAAMRAADGAEPPSPLAPGPTALQALQVCCQYAHVAYDELDARILLDTFGVPPDAPAAGYAAAINEAVQRVRDRPGGAR